ncbi:hypothetical protein B0H67DRAFT_548838 [Lasiosphaeris hirsuta]|uniref:Uncharacterized protein n=1 Tax=Lasiosphaeris hirsuta TaxID=260670 RepID=A0AA40BB97_9PEZI|nr:hypothetical protein B0H67DRAFT_548838 [Lasiosphaeris hirsuta]
MAAPRDTERLDIILAFRVGSIVSHSLDERTNMIHLTAERLSEDTVDTPSLSQASSSIGESSDSLATPSESSRSRDAAAAPWDADRASHTATHGTASPLGSGEGTSRSRAAAPAAALLATPPAHVGSQFANVRIAQEGRAGERGIRHASGSTALCLDGATGIETGRWTTRFPGAYPPDIDSLEESDTSVDGMPTPCEAGAKTQTDVSPDDVIAMVGRMRDELYASRFHARRCTGSGSNRSGSQQIPPIRGPEWSPMPVSTVSSSVYSSSASQQQASA